MHISIDSLLGGKEEKKKNLPRAKYHHNREVTHTETSASIILHTLSRIYKFILFDQAPFVFQTLTVLED